jgi:hypothetical protein
LEKCSNSLLIDFNGFVNVWSLLGVRPSYSPEYSRKIAKWIKLTFELKLEILLNHLEHEREE